MIHYTSSITKEEIEKLPLESFPGRIIVIDTERNAEKAINYLSGYACVGFDTETRPSFRKGQHYKVSLIQISTEEACFLFRLNMIGFPESLKEFFMNKGIAKIGLSLRDDFCAIRKRCETDLNGFIDIQQIIGNYGIEDISLQKVYAILFGKKIAKTARLSNWEADVLSEKQQKYAALDAWACLKIHNALNQNK